MARFCGKCGRKLEDGEVCNCSEKTVGINVPAKSTQEDDSADYRQIGQLRPGAQRERSQARQGGSQDGRRQYQQRGQYQQQARQSRRDSYYEDGSGQRQYRAGQQDSYYDQDPYYGQDPDDPYYEDMDNHRYQRQQGRGNRNYDGGNYDRRNYRDGYDRGPGRSREMEWLNNKKDSFVAGTKNMFSEILPILKAPVSRVRTIARTNNIAVGLEFILTKMAVCLLFILLLIFKAVSTANSYSREFGIRASDYVDIPYFRLILVVIVVTVGIDFLRALIQLGIAKAFGGGLTFNASVTIIGAGAMYISIFGAIGGLLSFLLLPVGLIIVAIGVLIAPFVEFADYIAVVEGIEDRKPYAYLITMVLTTIASSLVMALVGATLLTFLERMF